MATPNLTAIDFSKKGAAGGKDDFKLTPDEAKRLEEKMKDPEFMKLWVEYAQSLADPKVKAEEEAYLQQVEEEAKAAGDDSFDFVFPTAHYAVEIEPGVSGSNKLKGHRVAVNMCSSDKIERFREETTGDRMGSHWYVPVSVGAQHVEKGVAGSDWEVYDAVFHPLTIDLALRSDRFRVFLCEIAVEHINGGYKRSFDFKFAPISFPSGSDQKSIGTPKNQTVRRSKDGKKSGHSNEDREISFGPMKAKFADDNNTSSNEKKPPSSSSSSSTKQQQQSSQAAAATPAPPKKLHGDFPITVMHRGEIDLTDAWNWSKLEKRIGIPRELVLKAQLAGVESARDIDVEVLGGVKVEIKAPGGKSGSMMLDFTVEEDPVSAKFDKTKKELTLVLKVVPPPAPPSALAEKSMPAASQSSSSSSPTVSGAATEKDEEQEAEERRKQQAAAAAKKKREAEDAEANKAIAARAKQAADAVEKKKLQDAQDAVSKEQQKQADKMRQEQERWLKEEETRRNTQRQKEQEEQEEAANGRKKKQQEKHDEEKKKAKVATAAKEKKKEAEEAAEAKKAAAAKQHQQQAAAAAAAGTEILMLDDDDEEFTLPAEQRAKLEDAAAMREVARKKADAERQEELLQAALDKKMKALPLTNDLIFRID